MSLINGKEFIYDLDTVDTFKIRVASKLNTLPEYLYFENDDMKVLTRDKDYKAVDFLAVIRDFATKNVLITELPDKIKEQNFDMKEYILPVWFAYNKTVNENYKSQRDLLVEKLENDIKKITKNVYSHNIKEWLRNSSTKLQRLKESIEKNKEKAKEYEKTFTDFTESKSIPSTDFNTEYTISTLVLESQDHPEYNLSLLELFNESVLTSSVPFITTQNFYKIAQGFIPADDWVKTSSDSIILKVASKVVFDNENTSNYTDVIIKVNDTTHAITAEIIVYLSKKDNIASKEKYIKRVLKVFTSLNLQVKESKESKVTGTFYFPNKKIDKYVFSDLVMNDKLFKSVLKIDEHESATKKKTYLFIQFYHPNTGNIKANIFSRVANKLTLLDDQPLTIFPDKSNFISVKIKEASNTASVTVFKDMLGKLLGMYDEKAKEVIAFYSKYIDNFGEEQEEKEEEKDEEETKKLSEIAPEIFVSNYTRNCPHTRMPTIIPEEMVASARERGQSVIKFPRDIPTDPNAVRFPNDGENQHYYVCNNKQYKYVGLAKNRLKNADKFPYVPCGFKNDQSTKPKFLNYYEGKETITQSKFKHQDIIKTNKVLDNNRFGSLPNDIENLFTFVYPDQTYEYVRKGVFKNNHSFLNCVMEAFDEKTNILSLTDEAEREEFLIAERKKLATESLASLCRQELYDKKVKDIMKMIENPEVYLNPTLFVHLLEYYYKCNIFIFTKLNILSDGEMVLPRHLQSYYTYKNDYPCIYIYEHPKNEKHCELIIKYNTVKQEEPQYLFTKKEARNIKKLFLKLNDSYALSTHIKELKLPLSENIEIESQKIDSYGKARRLNIKYKGNKICMFTDPIQPVNARETATESIKQTTKEIALEFIKELGIDIKYQGGLGNKTYELNGVLGNVNVSIPVKEFEKSDDIPFKQEELNFSPNKNSVLDLYNKNKKIARYLIEYALWTHSKYMKDNEIKESSDNHLAEFGKSMFQIIPNFQYGNIIKIFNMEEDTSPTKDGKIVVHDMDTLKRLLYVVRLAIQSNKNRVKQYYKKIFMENYYVDITDFKERSNQRILYGDEAVENWINESSSKRILYDGVQIGYNTPYFFKNPLIKNIVYLAQNTTTIEKAMDISLTWIKDGYNKGIFAKSHERVAFTLYSFSNSTNIKKYKMKTGDKTFSDKIKIIGYKIEGVPYYTCLLELD